MADREGVKTASKPLTALAVLGLAETMINGLVRIPFQKPLSGPGGILDNIGQSVTRQCVRSFLGYSISLPIDEFRSLEKVLDDLCGVVLPPVVTGLGGVRIEKDTIGGQHGLWCREKPEVAAHDDPPTTHPKTILYLHGGGYFGTTPAMYTMFAAALVRLSRCQVFIPDYRMSPEFPFPAGMLDAADVYQSLIHDEGIPPEDIIIAGDSGGGGLATSLIVHLHEQGLPKPAGLALFSPEVNLAFNQDSVMDNMGTDVLPWNIPVTAYLRGIEPDDERVSIVYANPDPDWFPPTFVCWGQDEMFRDAVQLFADELRAGGVPVMAMEEPGMFHVFPILMPWSEAAKRVFQAIESLAHDRVHARTGDDIVFDTDTDMFDDAPAQSTPVVADVEERAADVAAQTEELTN